MGCGSSSAGIESSAAAAPEAGAKEKEQNAEVRSSSVVAATPSPPISDTPVKAAALAANEKTPSVTAAAVKPSGPQSKLLEHFESDDSSDDEENKDMNVDPASLPPAYTISRKSVKKEDDDNTYEASVPEGTAQTKNLEIGSIAYNDDGSLTSPRKAAKKDKKDKKEKKERRERERLQNEMENDRTV